MYIVYCRILYCMIQNYIFFQIGWLGVQRFLKYLLFPCWCEKPCSLSPIYRSYRAPLNTVQVWVSLGMFTKYCLSEALRCKKWEQRQPFLFPGLWNPMDDISSSLLFLVLSHIFSGVEFLGLINFIKFTRMRESVERRGLERQASFFCSFVC